MPFELRHVNVYLLRDGDHFSLIDTGLQTQESRETLNRKLDEMSLPVERINRILITHIHPDHFGLAGELRDRARAELVIHRLEVALMEPRYARAEDLVHDVAAWLSKNGVPAAEAEFIKSASMAAREFVSVVEPDTLLEGAERLSIDDSELAVVWTPGHSPGEPANRSSNGRLAVCSSPAITCCRRSVRTSGSTRSRARTRSTITLRHSIAFGGSTSTWFSRPTAIRFATTGSGSTPSSIITTSARPPWSTWRAMAPGPAGSWRENSFTASGIATCFNSASRCRKRWRIANRWPWKAGCASRSAESW